MTFATSEYQMGCTGNPLRSSIRCNSFGGATTLSFVFSIRILLPIAIYLLSNVQPLSICEILLIGFKLNLQTFVICCQAAKGLVVL